MLKELIKYRDLLYMLTWRDIRVRYKQAAMGFAWAIFMPVVAISAGILIKGVLAYASGKTLDTDSILTITVRILPWAFFVSAIKFSVQSLIGNSQLVTKIYFPKKVLPIAATLACFFDFLISIIALTAILMFFNIGLSVHILFVPVLVLFLVLFTMGLGLILSSANVFFRDVKYIVDVILTFGIFFTPVLYDVSMVGKYKAFFLANPLTGILESLSSVVFLHQMPNMIWLTYAGITSTIVFVIGLLMFDKLEYLFAENI